jgi:HEPN domain-containing protein
MKELWLEDKEFLDKLEKQKFEDNSTHSLVWMSYAFDVFRAAEILAYHSNEANYIQTKRLLEEIQNSNNSKSSNRNLTIEEEIIRRDSNQIRTAFFLLARAIELLLKAVLIELNPTIFFDDKKYKLSFDLKNGHDLTELSEKAEVNLNALEKENLELLSHYPQVGTYPVPMYLKEQIKHRELKEKLNKYLNFRNYDQVASIFDIVLSKYNETRILNGKSTWSNLFKIEKQSR